MRRTLLITTFAVYLFVVAAITILPTSLSGGIEPHSNHVNLVPFEYTLRCFRLAYGRNPGLRNFCMLNAFGNIALFLPLGMLLPLATRFRSLKQVMLIALLLSCSIEGIQFALRFIGNARAVDIDDVLLNTFGALLGFVILWAVSRIRGRMQEQDTGVVSSKQ